MDFKFLTQSEYDLLDEIKRQAYEADVRKQWLIMTAEDNAICGFTAEQFQIECRLDAMEEAETQNLGGGLSL